MKILPRNKTLRYIIYILLLILLSILVYVGYLYTQGSKKNYTPPTVEVNTDEQQVINDLTSLSHAVESYYAINLSYPSSLKNLVPDFINKLPSEPQTNKDYIYKVFADSAYEVSVQNPQKYNLKEFRIRNGNLIKN